MSPPRASASQLIESDAKTENSRNNPTYRKKKRLISNTGRDPLRRYTTPLQRKKPERFRSGSFFMTRKLESVFFV